MALFKVVNIINGNTVEVLNWKWNDFSGKHVQIRGYALKDEQSNMFAKEKLEVLLKGKEVELRAPVSAEKRSEGGDLITCIVTLNDIDVAKYFPEFSEGSKA